MEVKNKKIGFVLTGSFCTFKKTIPQIKKLKNLGADIIPIMSFNSYNLDTKFGKAKDFIKEIEEISEKEIIHTIQDAEPIGPKHLTDIMIVAPASGNTMSKLACDIIDTPATMAVKSHLRNNLPVVIAPSTNNGLGANMVSIAKLINRKNYYFVPFRQDNPLTKPRSVVFDPEYILKTVEFALDGKQIEPILI
ncbi:MAG: dipicolinate synthase subunit B [Clostridia bacterium]|nr:dipicolinate synthase subunit B [Clostridia bacterium]